MADENRFMQPAPNPRAGLQGYEPQMGREGGPSIGDAFMAFIAANPMFFAGAGIGTGIAGVGGLRGARGGYQALREMGYGRAGAAGREAADIAGGIGVTGGAGAALGGVFDHLDTLDRRHLDTLRDAEGQPGGFYGNALMRGR